MKRQKVYTKKETPQRRLGCLKATNFSVDQDYSLTSCSPAELVSAYPDKLNIQNTHYVKQKSYPQFLGFRV